MKPPIFLVASAIGNRQKKNTKDWLMRTSGKLHARLKKLFFWLWSIISGPFYLWAGSFDILKETQYYVGIADQKIDEKEKSALPLLMEQKISKDGHSPQ